MDKNILKYFLRGLQKSEANECLRRIESNEASKAEYIRLRNTLALSHLSPRSINKSEGRKNFRIFMRQNQTRERRKIVLVALRYSAIAAVIMMATFLPTQYYYKNKAGDAGMNTLHVPAGQRARLTLQDGTEVWLNASSTLSYPSHFSEDKREVSMTGEAFFNVTENSEKPFIVSCGNVEIKVLGTQFNVYCYPQSDYLETSLIEGALKVYKKESEETAVILKPNERLTIKEDKMEIDEMVDFSHLLWKEGIYTFENETLLNIIEKLQLYYDVEIVVQSPALAEVIYTGKFRQRDGIDEILKIIQRIQNFNIEKDTKNNKIILTK